MPSPAPQPAPKQRPLDLYASRCGKPLTPEPTEVERRGHFRYRCILSPGHRGKCDCELPVAS